MAQAYFSVPFDEALGHPVLPKSDAESGYGSALFDGQPGRGFVSASHAPGNPTVIVFVDGPDAVIAAMKADTTYQHIEDVP